jgi:hypothetical protein
LSEFFHFALTATLRTAMAAEELAIAFDIVAERRRAANPAPKAKRITGPNVFAAAIPTK